MVSSFFSLSSVFVGDLIYTRRSCMCISICVGQLHQLILYAHRSLLAGSNLYEFMYIRIFSCFCCIGELGIGSNEP
jgi:hypothetical protein